MINNIWFYMIVVSIIFGLFTGNVNEITDGVIQSSVQAVELCITFVGVWALWLGLMEIVKQSGLINTISRIMYPIIKKLFPEVPKDHPALGAISLNFSANILGLGNAATPFGLKVMKELQSINRDKGVASDAMCMFLVINTSSIQLIPTTVIALRASMGSVEPAAIVLSSIITTCISTFVGVGATIIIRRKEEAKGRRKSYG
ncbi:nucleoside recognition protein [Alkalibaculum sp. M08DMB]|uniref:Nucleoside recognition protein n=1 Tax=Alkalibaculum sporogenes TaxID=2655001 RepID=A0A6A7K718_9FIRM|nr:nucleoside recognition domain-containing protein [Alkalibaculum sporogenes]MPW25289.1 nucleoside recognition protein [Alkalibaculum sporogenes]